MVQGGGRLGQGRRQRGEAAVARRQAAGGDAGDRRKPRPQAAGRRAGRERRAEKPGGARRPQDRRPDRRDRRPARSRTPMPSTTASPPSRSAAPRKIGMRARRQGEPRLAVALEAAPETPRDEIVIQARSPFHGREGRQSLARARRRTATRSVDRRASSIVDVARRFARRRVWASSRGDVVLAVNNDEDRARRATSSASPGSRPALGASRSCAAGSEMSRRAAADENVRRRNAQGPSLFAAAGLDRDAPRPLADKLRPAQARRGGRPGSSARPGRRAHPHARDPLARLAGLLGAARHRQDHGGAAAGRRDRRCISSRSRRSFPASPT